MNETIKKLTEEVSAKMIEIFQSAELKEFVEKTKAAIDSGSFEVVISTADFDRQGESIDQNGWDLINYKNNPVVLWGHDYWSLPIGITDDIEAIEGKLVAKGRFAPEEANPFAQQVRRLYDLKIVRATSVGFIAREMQGSVITKAELLEFSFVPVPANPFSLSLSKAQELKLDLAMLATKGITIETKAEGDVCTLDDGTEGEMHPNADGEMVCMPKEGQKPEPEDTGDFVIIRVKDPDYFDPDSFRTIVISEDKGIKATIGCKKGEFSAGKCSIGTEVQRYLFDKEKWTIEEAQAWVDENSKTVEATAAEQNKKKDAQQIGAVLSQLQSTIDNALVEASREILAIVESEYGSSEEGKALILTAIQTIKKAFVAFEKNLGSIEGEEHRDGGDPNQRSQDAGVDALVKKEIENFDEFLMARQLLKSITTQASEALERINEKMRAKRNARANR